MEVKTVLTALTLAVLALFVAGGVVSAKDGNSGKGGGKGGKGGSNSSADTRLEADLEPCCNTPEPKAEGDAERRTQTKNNAIKDDRFKVEVELPIPNTLGIDVGTARTADIRLILTRGTTDYAECRLVFDEIQQDKTTGQIEAEYKLDLRANKTGKGSCDGGLPAVQAGDVSTATLVANPADRTLDVDLLQGTFEVH